MQYCIPVTIVHVHCHMDWFSNIYLRNQNRIDYRQGKSKGDIVHVWYRSAVGFFKEQEIIHFVLWGDKFGRVWSNPIKSEGLLW